MALPCWWRKESPVFYDSKEGDGDDGSRINKLQDYVARYLRVVADLRAKFERSPQSQTPWEKCNKDGGSRNRMLFVQELSRRELE